MAPGFRSDQLSAKGIVIICEAYGYVTQQLTWLVDGADEWPANTLAMVTCYSEGVLGVKRVFDM
jgi:hypothetical protein